MNTAHIINHTHWDREWFLTSIYTSQWIPGLVDALVNNTISNPNYRYFLDGQTLVVEDLLGAYPEYTSAIQKLSSSGNLTIGPYYCQPDWQLTSGEALIRNLLYGKQDMARYSHPVKVGWLVDTFGHISQSPQIHHLFGIEAVYVWRGVPQMEPYFQWQGADGSQLFTVNLFGGYRNLYGVTHTAEIAVRRLQAEISKLGPYYPTADIPLFDGYDLETNPEDPVRFFEGRQAEFPPEIELCESSPPDFVAKVRPKQPELPTIAGELNSGKYGATFPGTLSSRIYLKIMSHDCEHLLYQVCEPLATLASLKGRPYPAEQYEGWGRGLLQNSVHDCICGVSIDQVHAKMEVSYQRIFEAIKSDISASLDTILGDFAPGVYTLSTNPFPYEGWQVLGDRLYSLRTGGVGAWQARDIAPVEEPHTKIETFSWENEHYHATLGDDGVVHVDQAALGMIVVSREKGDTYSAEIGNALGTCKPTGPLLIEQKSAQHCVLRIPYQACWEHIQITADVRLIFDQSPLIRWQIDLDSRGTDFRIELIFETANPGQIYAGMPFDVVERQQVDEDLLPRKVNEGLEKILLGQREIGQVSTFPFHGFVSVGSGTRWTTILAQGLHAYQADEGGRITVPLRRAVEWLTRPNLEYRLGDAGPFFYVPEARCERKVTHYLAVMFTRFGVEDTRFHALNAGFQNPPLIAEASGSGNKTEWLFLSESLPMSSLQLAHEQILARFFNPTSQPLPLSQPRLKTDVAGHPESRVESVAAKGILTMDLGSSPARPVTAASGSVSLLSELRWRVGANKSTPDPEVIHQLQDKITRCQAQLAEISRGLEAAQGRERYFLEHQASIVERELLEYQLSVRLNEIKLMQPERSISEVLFTPDAQIAAIGWQLNQARIKRRIYDYVVQTL